MDNSFDLVIEPVDDARQINITVSNVVEAAGRYIPTLQEVSSQGNTTTNELYSSIGRDAAGLTPDGRVFFARNGKRLKLKGFDIAQDKTFNFDGNKPDGDIVAMVSDVAGLTIEVNQAAAELYLKDINGNNLATVNLGFLNNEGTTLFYNEITNNLELKNEAGEVLSSFPLGSFVSNIVTSASFNSSNPSTLDFKDSSNTVRYSVPFSVSNISGLQSLLDAKVGQSNIQISANTAGSNTYTATISPAISSYIDKAKFFLKFTTSNTGAATLNINGLGAKAITLFGSALVTGVIQANRIYMVVYNQTTDSFALHGAQDPSKLNVAANATLAAENTRVGLILPDGTITYNLNLYYDSSTRTLYHGTSTNPGKLEIGSTISRIKVQTNIASGNAFLEFNANQESAYTIKDSDGTVYMAFRSIAGNKGLIFYQACVLDQALFHPVTPLQAAITSVGAGIKVYGKDSIGNIVSIPFSVDGQLALFEVTFMIKNSTASQVIAGKFKAIAKRTSAAGGSITIVSQATEFVSNNSVYTGAQVGIEAVSNTSVRFYFTPDAADSTAYTGAFPKIEYTFN